MYKWGWDQKRKTFGDDAVLMMPPFSSFGFGAEDQQYMPSDDKIFDNQNDNNFNIE